MKQIGPRQTPGPDCVQGGCAAQPHRAGRARRTGRNWCDAAAPTAIRHAPRDGLQPRSGTVPPATAYRPRPGVVPRCDGAPASLRCHAPPRDGVSASPWSRPPCDGAPTSLWSCASATAYRHRSGAASPATAFRPCSGGHDLCPDAALRRCTPTGDHDSRPGDHDSRSGVAPPVLGGFPAAMPRPTLPWGPRSSPGGVRDAKTVGFGRWRSKQTVFRGLGSEKWTFLSVVRVGAFR